MNGIRRRLATPYSPQHNIVAERKNRTLEETARCLLIHAGFSPVFWAEAVAAADYIRNRCSSRSLRDEIPFER